jgi:hypothetical protein
MKHAQGQRVEVKWYLWIGVFENVDYLAKKENRFRVKDTASRFEVFEASP